MFDWQKFWSCFMVVLGAIGIAVAIVAACDARDFLLFLLVVPGVAVTAAGLAIID